MTFAKRVKVDDWVMEDTDEIVDKIVGASGKSKNLVVLYFKKPDDYREFVGRDSRFVYVSEIDRFFEIPDAYTDALYLQGLLADRGYPPVNVYQACGNRGVIFQFS